jgi:Putative beta-barrel porin 2
MKNKNLASLCRLVCAFLWMCHAAEAQQGIFGNAPTNNYQIPTNSYQSQSTGPTTPGSVQFGAPYMGTSALPGSGTAGSLYTPTGPPLTSWGPLAVYPHLLYMLTYGNGIEAQPGVNSTTFINTVAPGVFFKIGSHWDLDYTPTLAFYSNPIFRDTTGQRVVLVGGTIYGAWSLNLLQSYVNTADPLVETGTQIQQEAYATALNAVWQMGEKTSLQLGLNQNFRSAQSLNNLHEWSSSDWLNYQFQPQLLAGIGVTGGYDEVSLGSDMPFEQVQGKVIFQPGTKLSLLVVGGAEDREFVHPSAPAVVTPIFNASLMYRVFDRTTVTLGAARTVTPSFYGNEYNVITRVSGNIHHDFTEKLYLEVIGGYTSEPFTSIEPGPLPPYFFGKPPVSNLAVTRSDTRAYGQIRLSTVIRTRLTASVFGTYSQNDSSQANFKYSGQQVGLELNFKY